MDLEEVNVFALDALVALPSPSFDPPGSNTFFYLQNKKNDGFLFCFGCPCLPPDWESETRDKLFGVLGRRGEEREQHPG